MCIPNKWQVPEHQVDRAAAARYGVGVGDAQQVIENAIGETNLP
jgi:Cu/Ag efflux pump CusA